MLFIAVFGLLAAAALLAFGDAQAAGGMLLVIAGLIAAVKSRSMAKAQNGINQGIGRYSWNPWGSVSPRLFVIWGVGMAIIGLAMVLKL